MSKKKYPVIIGIIAIIVVVVSYLIKDLIPAWLVIPLFEFLQLIDRNQDIIWVYFLFVVLFYSVMKIIKTYADIRAQDIFGQKKKKDTDDIGRTEMMAWMIDQIQEGTFSKIRLARYLSELILEIQAYQQQKSPGIVLNQLKEGILPVPENLREYMKASLLYRPADLAIKKRWFFWRKHPHTVLDLDPEIVVNYMETQMDVRKQNEN
jgi:hypothetical protein